MIRMISAAIAVSVLTLCLPLGAELNVANPVWVQYPGSAQRDATQSIRALPDGSVLVTGWFEGVYDAELATQPPTFGMRDIFWAKYDPQGHLLWVKSAGSEHCDVSADISALPDGSCAVVCAYGYGGIAGVFGEGEPNRTRLSSYDKWDIALVKLNPDGTVVWARRMGSYNFDYGDSVALTPNGGCFVTGDFTGLKCHFGDDDGVAGNEVVIEGSPNSFLAFFDTNGVFKWVKSAQVLDVKALSDNTCLATYNGYVHRYSQDGDLLWSSEEAFPDPVDFCCPVPNTRQVIFQTQNMTVLRKYEFQDDNSLTLLWEKPFEGITSFICEIDCRPDGSFILNDRAFSVAYMFDAGGNLLGSTSYTGLYLPIIAASPLDDNFYATCYFDGDTVIGQGTPGETPLAYRGDGDMVIVKFDPIILYRLSVTAEGPGTVVLDPPGGTYVAGTEVTVTPYPRISARDEFVEWQGDFDSYTEPKVTVTMGDGDLQATAVFAVIPGAPSLPAVTALGLLVLAIAPAAYALKRKRLQ